MRCSAGVVVIDDEGMRVPPLTAQMRVIERQVVVRVFENFGVLSRPEEQRGNRPLMLRTLGIWRTSYCNSYGASSPQ